MLLLPLQVRWDTFRYFIVQGTSASVVSLDFQESNDQGLEQVAKQGASLTQKSHGSSIARSGRAKLKPEKAMRMGTRRSERLASNKRT
jgi:hypothetical protein